MQLISNNIEVGLTKEEYVYLEILKSFIISKGSAATSGGMFSILKKDARAATTAIMEQLNEINPPRPADANG